MDTKQKKLKAIADAAAKKNISLDSILKYLLLHLVYKIICS